MYKHRCITNKGYCTHNGITTISQNLLHIHAIWEYRDFVGTFKYRKGCCPVPHLVRRSTREHKMCPLQAWTCDTIAASTLTYFGKGHTELEGNFVMLL